MRSRCAVAIRVTFFIVAFASSHASQAIAALHAIPSPRLEVINMTRFFVTPNRPAVLSWKLHGVMEPPTLHWNISNYWGKPIATGSTLVIHNRIRLPVRLPRGFYQVDFPATGQQFGVAAIAAYHGPKVHFFAIDSEMGSLVQLPESQSERVGMINIIHRSGIGMAREYFSWSQINPAPEKYNWNGSAAFKFYAGLKKFATVPGRYSRTGRLANDYLQGGLRIMQMFRDAPPWTWNGSSGPYPMNLDQTAKSWVVIGQHFQRIWKALEVWNEPDIAGLPPDQLLPMVKTIAYSFHHAHIDVPLIGGAFGDDRVGFFQDACARNGLLVQCNAISFHDYNPPTDILPAVASYRKWLGAFGKPSMPLWLGESGRPWPCRPNQPRPSQQSDMQSANWITMKAVEARACGVARYFAFCVPYFNRFGSNYGMMGKDLTPLRSMVAYLNCVAELSGWSYLGNLKIANHEVILARVFARGNQRIAVVYTGRAAPLATINLALHGITIRGIDGRVLHRNANGSIPVPDGLVYLRGPAASFADMINSNTRAARLYAISRRPPPPPQHYSPIILQLAQAPGRWSGQAYALVHTSQVSLAVRVWNLADHAITVKLFLRSDHPVAGWTPVGWSIRRQIPAHGHVLVQWHLRNPAGIVPDHYLVITGNVVSGKANAPAISPLAILVR